MVDVAATVVAALLLLQSRSSVSPPVVPWKLALLYVGWAFLTGVVAHDWLGVSTVWNRALLSV